MKKIALVGLALLALGLEGCTTRVTDFTVISTKNTTVVNGKKKGERVTGDSCVPVVFGPIGAPNLNEAIDHAIESAGPGYDALVDGVVYYKNKSFIFGEVCYEVDGTALGSSDHASTDDVWLHSSIASAK